MSVCLTHSPSPPQSLHPLGASDLWNQAHDKHPADDDLPEPEERLLPAASTWQQAGPPLSRRGSPDPAGGRDPADREEETRSLLSPQERPQGQRPLFCWYERAGD